MYAIKPNDIWSGDISALDKLLRCRNGKRRVPNDADRPLSQSQARLQLQLAPSMEHQVAAMLSILVRYNWRQFSVVTSEIAGHDDFMGAVRDKVAAMKATEQFRWEKSTVASLEHVTSPSIAASTSRPR